MAVIALGAPFQTVDPTAVLDLPGLVRGAAAFGVVLVLGAGLLWRFNGLVDRSISASMDRPLSSLGYGIAAHATIAFFGAYAASQLGQLSVSGRTLGGVGVWVAIVLLAVVAAVGFTVVGVAVVEVGLERRREFGIVLGAVLAGGAAVVEPLFGGLVWLVVVSTGIGGSVRVWFHAAEDVEAAR